VRERVGGRHLEPGASEAPRRPAAAA
jgi:hypothetical protein